MGDQEPRVAPNYTSACLVMFGVNAMWILVAIWALWGMLMALLLAWVIHYALGWLGYFSALRRQAAIRRGKP